MSTVFASITTPGPAGPPGRTALWLTGAGAPVTAQGLDGDMYLNSTTGDVYGPKATTWGGIVRILKVFPEDRDLLDLSDTHLSTLLLLVFPLQQQATMEICISTIPHRTYMDRRQLESGVEL